MIRELPIEVRNAIRTGLAVASMTQCIEELIFNALDAGATSIAIRVDFLALKIQVVDNGCGMDKNTLNLIGLRYMTSKCHSLEDLRNPRGKYGFRGEALASLRKLAKVLKVESRSAHSQDTFVKVFKEGESLDAELSKAKRPSRGTTITVYDFMYNMPVRRHRLKDALNLEDIKNLVETTALTHPTVSFSLRNDVSGNIILQTHKTKDTLKTFSFLFGEAISQTLILVTHTLGSFKVHGFISNKAQSHKSLQFIYVNKRLVRKTKLHKIVDSILMKSSICRSNLGREPRVTKQRSMGAWLSYSPPPHRESYPVYLIDITCAYTEYDLCFDQNKSLIEFRNWDPVLKCLEEVVVRFLKENIDDVGEDSKEPKKNEENRNVVDDDNNDCEQLDINDSTQAGRAIRGKKAYRQNEPKATKSKRDDVTRSKSSPEKDGVECKEISENIISPESEVQLDSSTKEPKKNRKIQISKRTPQKRKLLETNRSNNCSLLSENPMVFSDSDSDSDDIICTGSFEKDLLTSKQMTVALTTPHPSKKAKMKLNNVPRNSFKNTCNLPFHPNFENRMYFSINGPMKGILQRTLKKFTLIKLYGKIQDNSNIGCKSIAIKQRENQSSKIHKFHKSPCKNTLTKPDNTQLIVQPTNSILPQRFDFNPILNEAKTIYNQIPSNYSKHLTNTSQWPNNKPSSDRVIDGRNPCTENLLDITNISVRQYRRGTPRKGSGRYQCYTQSPYFSRPPSPHSVTDGGKYSIKSPYFTRSGSQHDAGSTSSRHQSSEFSRNHARRNSFATLPIEGGQQSFPQQSPYFVAPSTFQHSAAMKPKQLDRHCFTYQSPYFKRNIAQVTPSIPPTSDERLPRLLSSGLLNKSRGVSHRAGLKEVCIESPLYFDFTRPQPKSGGSFYRGNNSVQNEVRKSTNCFSSLGQKQTYPEGNYNQENCHSCSMRKECDSVISCGMYDDRSYLTGKSETFVETNTLNSTENGSDDVLSIISHFQNSKGYLTTADLVCTLDTLQQCYNRSNQQHSKSSISWGGVRYHPVSRYINDICSSSNSICSSQSSSSVSYSESSNSPLWKAHRPTPYHASVEYQPESSLHSSRASSIISYGDFVKAQSQPTSVDLHTREHPRTAASMASSECSHSVWEDVDEQSPMNFLHKSRERQSNFQHSGTIARVRSPNNESVLSSPGKSSVYLLAPRDNQVNKIILPVHSFTNTCTYQRSKVHDWDSYPVRCDQPRLPFPFREYEPSGQRRKHIEEFAPALTWERNQEEETWSLSKRSRWDDNVYHQNFSTSLESDTEPCDVIMTPMSSPYEEEVNLPVANDCGLSSQPVANGGNIVASSSPSESNNGRPEEQNQECEIQKNIPISGKDNEEISLHTSSGSDEVRCTSGSDDVFINSSVGLSEGVENAQQEKSDAVPETQTEVQGNVPRIGTPRGEKEIGQVPEKPNLPQSNEAPPKPTSNEQASWVQRLDAGGKTIYVHRITGMTSFQAPSSIELDSYSMTRRYHFLPKGISPILHEKDGGVVRELSPNSRDAVHHVIEEVASTTEVHQSREDQPRCENLIKRLIEDAENRMKYCEASIPNASIEGRNTVMVNNLLTSHCFTNDVFKSMEVLGQLDNKFIITLVSLEAGKRPHLLVFFDQHAVDERVRVERIVEDYFEENSSSRFKSSPLDTPLVVNFTPQELRMVANYEREFERLGLAFIEATESSLEITAVPTCLKTRVARQPAGRRASALAESVATLVKAHATSLRAGGGVGPRLPIALQTVINSEACRGAIKFGDSLTTEECEKMLTNLGKCLLPFQCAHGRPSLVTILDMDQVRSSQQVGLSSKPDFSLTKKNLCVNN